VVNIQKISSQEAQRFNGGQLP